MRRHRIVTRTKRLIFFIVLFSFVGPIFLSVFRLVTFRGDVNEAGRTQADYAVILLQSLAGLVLMFLPQMINRRHRLDLPSGYYYVFIVFLYCAIFLGEIENFFYRYRHWDTFLHTFSGFALGAVGFYVVSFLNDSEKVHIRLSVSFVALFSFCFALAAGAVWEIFEFTADGVLGVNMQKFALESGSPLVGRAAVADTMEDLIVDALGALVFVIIGAMRERKLRRESPQDENGGESE